MTQQEVIINTIKVLRKEVEVLTTRLRPTGTGYLHTAIDVINSRIDELIGKAIDNEPDQVRGLAGKIFDDVEHTKEYYDTQRNRPMEGEDFHLEPLPINTFE